MVVVRLFCIVALLALSLPAPAGKIVINEAHRGTGTWEQDEFVELLIIEQMTADELDGYYVGDTSGLTPFSKNWGSYKFSNMSSIAPVFPGGTLLVVGGTQAFAEDLSYNPAAGDKTLLLTAGGSHAVRQGANVSDMGSAEVVWVDRSGSGTVSLTDGFAIRYTVSGSMPVSVTLASSPAFGKSAALNAASAGQITAASSWTVTANATPGLPNGPNNLQYIGTLPVSLSAFSAE